MKHQAHGGKPRGNVWQCPPIVLAADRSGELRTGPDRFYTYTLTPLRTGPTLEASIGYLRRLPPLRPFFFHHRLGSKCIEEELQSDWLGKPKVKLLEFPLEYFPG